MKTLCDGCESAAAILFCAADEAALCAACDEKVHMCNKLASRHVRVGLAAPSNVPQCDICENAPAYFYCEIDGSSLCLQCDMIVHVGSKRKHKRYLLLRQRVEFPGDKSEHLDEARPQPNDPSQAQREPNHSFDQPPRENQQNLQLSRAQPLESNIEGGGKMGNKLIDLNARPERILGQASNIEEQGMEVRHGTKYESTSNVPAGFFNRKPEK